MINFHAHFLSWSLSLSFTLLCLLLQRLFGFHDNLINLFSLLWFIKTLCFLPDISLFFTFLFVVFFIFGLFSDWKLKTWIILDFLCSFVLCFSWARRLFSHCTIVLQNCSWLCMQEPRGIYSEKFKFCLWCAWIWGNCNGLRAELWLFAK